MGTTTPWTPPVFRGQPRTVRLSPRRADVLNCLCRGHDNAGIGEQLRLSLDTVKTHIRAVFAALGAKDRVHAVVLVFTGQVRVEVGHAEHWRCRTPKAAGALPHGVAAQARSASEAALPHPAGRSET